MTREQAKREIDSLDYYLQNHTDDYSEESHTAMMMAIKALEQEPCEDAISRQAALDVIAETDITNGTKPVFTGKQVQALLRDLPSVTPKQRTGHWIETWLSFWCSECKTQFGGAYKFCPNCGAKMESEEQA